MRDKFANPDNDPRGPYCAVDLTMPGSKPPLLYEWQGILPPRGRCWRITRERGEEMEADGRVIWPKRSRLPRMKRYLADLPDHRNDDVLDASGAATKIQLVLRKALRAIASEIARTPRALGAVEWRDLERVLREVFESIGFDTRLTRPGRDGGFDLEVSCFEEGRKEVYLVEVKHWKPPSRPGMAIVSRFTEVVIAERADRGLLLSSSGFTREVIRGRSEVEQQLVRIGSDSKIVTLCQLYVRNGRGAWLSTSALPEILFHGTI